MRGCEPDKSHFAVAIAAYVIAGIDGAVLADTGDIAAQNLGGQLANTLLQRLKAEIELVIAQCDIVVTHSIHQPHKVTTRGNGTIGYAGKEVAARNEGDMWRELPHLVAKVGHERIALDGSVNIIVVEDYYVGRINGQRLRHGATGSKKGCKKNNNTKMEWYLFFHHNGSDSVSAGGCGLAA